MEELGDETPASIHFDVGKEDQDLMYVDVNQKMYLYGVKLVGIKKPTERISEEGGSSLEEDVHEHFKILIDKHEDNYFVPQRRL